MPLHENNAYDNFETEAVEGGFTAAKKFIIKKGPLPEDWEFVKKVDLDEHPEERIILATEIQMYDLIHQVPRISQYYPSLISHKADDSVAQLDLQYLANVSWGGPFDERNIKKLAAGLHDIHTTPLEPSVIDAIRQPASKLLKQVFATSEYAFDDEQKEEHLQRLFYKNSYTITNSRGHSYFDNLKVADEIIQTSRLFLRFDGKSFLLADLNFGNIAFSDDQVYFVDPVYVNIGNAASDDASVGLNIMRSLSLQKQGAGRLAALASELFLKDKEAFAYTLAYCMACTTLPYRGESDPWMDFHQELAEAGLDTWQRMY